MLLLVLVATALFLLKPRAEGEETADDTDVPVHVARIVRATFHRTVGAYGIVVPAPPTATSPAAFAHVSTSLVGTVTTIHAIEGEQVVVGDLLFELDDRIARSEVFKAEAALRSAQASFVRLKSTPRREQVELAETTVEAARLSVGFAQRAYERQKALMEDDSTSTRRLEEAELHLASERSALKLAETGLTLTKTSPTAEDLAEAEAKVGEAEASLAAARAQRTLCEIRAPLAGTVVRASVTPGQSVDVNAVLAELVDLDRLVVQATIPSADVGVVRLAQSVSIFADARPTGKPARAATGTVVFLGRQVDPATDGVAMRATVARDSGLMPGQYVRVLVVVEERDERLAVPKESVVRGTGGIETIAIVENDTASQLPVIVGIREGGLVEVSGEGIREGLVVVTAGAYGLPARTKVHVVSN